MRFTLIKWAEYGVYFSFSWCYFIVEDWSLFGFKFGFPILFLYKEQIWNFIKLANFVVYLEEHVIFWIEKLWLWKELDCIMDPFFISSLLIDTWHGSDDKNISYQGWKCGLCLIIWYFLWFTFSSTQINALGLYFSIELVDVV